LLGYSEEALAVANREAIELMAEFRDKYDAEETPFVISGNIGPRGDGYQIERKMTAEEAAAYHGEQVATFAGTEADMVSVLTMNYVEEAIGVTRAAAAFELPIALSFTVETDGRLPSGQPLAEAIEEVDHQTDSMPVYFMINCVLPVA
jgi:S-methylmethionine-dependent homocysteine/selenocysteine methylase